MNGQNLEKETKTENNFPHRKTVRTKDCGNEIFFFSVCVEPEP